jgi:hypothetical protein
MPDPDKQQFNLRLQRTLYARLRILADAQGVSMQDLVISILAPVVARVTLSSDDYARIANEVKRAEYRRLHNKDNKDDNNAKD